MKLSDQLLLTDGTLHYGMFPVGNVAISRHLATPGFPQRGFESLLAMICQYLISLNKQFLFKPFMWKGSAGNLYSLCEKGQLGIFIRFL